MRVWFYTFGVFLLVLAAGTIGYFMGLGGTLDNNQAPQGGGGLFDNRDITPKVEVVTLGEQNGSGQRGFALLREDNGKVKVSIRTIGEGDQSVQPAHIHTGSCPNPGEVLYTLNRVIDGDSETELNTTMEQLKSQKPLAINIHKSEQEASTYFSCGNIDS